MALVGWYVSKCLWSRHHLCLIDSDETFPVSLNAEVHSLQSYLPFDTCVCGREGKLPLIANRPRKLCIYAKIRYKLLVNRFPVSYSYLCKQNVEILCMSLHEICARNDSEKCLSRSDWELLWKQESCICFPQSALCFIDI